MTLLEIKGLQKQKGKPSVPTKDLEITKTVFILELAKTEDSKITITMMTTSTLNHSLTQNQFEYNSSKR